MSRVPRAWVVLALAAAALAAAASAAAASASTGTLASTMVVREDVEREVLYGEGGPIAYRERETGQGWWPPAGDAVLLEEAWWTPLRPLEPVVPRAYELQPDGLDQIGAERLSAWSLGDVTADGEDELVVSFRRPFQRNFMNVTRPRRAWVDAQGLSAHLGLYRPGDLDSIWVAGTLVSPVVALAACDGGLAVAYGDLDQAGTTETGAWRWVVFGFLPVEPLPGPGEPTCVDIDGDGRTEPAIVGRSGS
jgi:hypothetical protein